jgi:FAD:protein FMN transferase
VKPMRQNQTTSSANVSRLRIGMGTLIAIEAGAATLEVGLSGIEAAFAAIQQVESLMHPTREGSDLRAIHCAKIGLPVKVHAWTWEVLEQSQKLHRLSKGAFDPCLPAAVAGHTGARADADAGRFSDLELTAPGWVIPHAPLHLDLGGIAKGYAVDRALLALREAGCDSGLVNAGGDLAVFGELSRSIVITARGAGSDVVELENAAMASSDVNCAGSPAEHRGYYHGKTRRKIQAGRVTVRAACAALADALTKCVLADPNGRGEALLDMLDARLLAYNGSP